MLVSSAMFTLACAQGEAPRSRASAAARASASAAPKQAAELISYPPGRWRFADVRELESTVLWVSHILIRHSGSDLSVTGTVFDWRLDPPPPRTREEALALAKEVATQLRARPVDFAELALRHSEDSTSAALGGSLGGARASDYRLEPEVLDALAALSPGQISGVVETRHGFQIFRLEAVPPAGNVSGEHIVIGHDAATWLKIVGYPPPARSRREALALARQLHAEVSADPESFADRARKYSDYPDQASGGDLGSWSVREVTSLPRAIQALRSLPVGGISAPFESHFGIEIVRRTPDRERPLYAMQAIALAFAAGDAVSEREAFKVATDLVASLKLEPSRFDAFRAKYCCPGAESWLEGRDEPGLTSALAELSVGKIAAAPVRRFTTWVIPKRVEPSQAEGRPEARFVVPSPQRPKLEWMLNELPQQFLAEEIARLSTTHPALAKSERQRELLRRIERSAAASRPEFVGSVRALFEAKEAVEYQAILADQVGARILAAGRAQR